MKTSRLSEQVLVELLQTIATALPEYAGDLTLGTTTDSIDGLSQQLTTLARAIELRRVGVHRVA